jgi:ribosomal protein S27E
MISQEEIDKQWPGFTVTCNNCGSTLIELDDSLGFSAQSGGWGSIDIECLNCGNSTTLRES